MNWPNRPKYSVLLLGAKVNVGFVPNIQIILHASFCSPFEQQLPNFRQNAGLSASSKFSHNSALPKPNSAQILLSSAAYSQKFNS